MGSPSDEVVEKFNNGIEAVWSGSIGKYELKTFVKNDPESSWHYVLIVQGKGNSTEDLWFSESSGWTAAHETGHLLGLLERYEIWNPEKTPYPGYEKDLMGAPFMPLREGGLDEALQQSRSKHRRIHKTIRK